jgi:methylglyoxal synthase
VTTTIALVAHDNRKEDLVRWAEWNWRSLVEHRLVCTGTTGRLVKEALQQKMTTEYGETHDLNLTLLRSGPLGGDQQLGSMIADGDIDFFIFLWDPMQPHPHDVDVKALLRISVLYNIPTACNKATADFLISSSLFGSNYTREVDDHGEYERRTV